MYRIELTVLDKGALLSVTQSRHDRYPFMQAQAMANNYAKRYGLTARKVAGGFWPIADDRGFTVAQIAIRH